jgi:multiple sugar transport system substrate-binding protein
VASSTVRVLAASALVVLAATACGSDAATERRVLTVMMADDWYSVDAVTQAVQDFEADHPDVRVSMRGLPFGNIEEAIVNDLAGPREVDVAQFHAFAAAARGYAVDITDRFGTAYPDGTLLPGAIEDVTWKDRIYGVPLDVNALVLLVNRTALESLGFTVHDLATFEGMMEVAEATRDLPDLKFTAIASSSWASYGWIRANGGEVIEIGADEVAVTLDTPEVVEALDFLQQLTAGSDDDSLAFKPLYNDLSVDGFAVFRDGQTVLYPTGTWDAATLAANPPEWEWTTVPLPSGPRGDTPGATTLGGSSLYIPEGADDVDLAFEFMVHLTSPEYTLRYAKEQGRLPPQVAVLEDPFFDDPVYATVVDVLPHASAMRLIASPSATDVFSNALAEILNDRVGAAEMMAEAQVEASRGADTDLASG